MSFGIIIFLPIFVFLSFNRAHEFSKNIRFHQHPSSRTDIALSFQQKQLVFISKRKYQSFLSSTPVQRKELGELPLFLKSFAMPKERKYEISASPAQSLSVVTESPSYISKLFTDVEIGQKITKRSSDYVRGLDFSCGAANLSARPSHKPGALLKLWRGLIVPRLLQVRWGQLLAPKLAAIARKLPRPALFGIAAICSNEVLRRETKIQLEALPESMRPGATFLAIETLQNLGERLDFLAQKGWKFDALLLKEFDELKTKGIQHNPETETFIKGIINAQVAQIFDNFNVNGSITSLLTANTTSAGIKELQNIMPMGYRPRLIELERVVKKIEMGQEQLTFEDIMSVFADEEAIRYQWLNLKKSSEALFDENAVRYQWLDLKQTMEVVFGENFSGLRSSQENSAKDESRNVFEAVGSVFTSAKKQAEDWFEKTGRFYLF